MTIPLLIIDQRDTDIPDPSNVRACHGSRLDIRFASIAIVRGTTHFKCIKNRWSTFDDRECVPNALLKPYLMRYIDNFTAESLLEALIELR